jgi:hypothetical protein
MLSPAFVTVLKCRTLQMACLVTGMRKATNAYAITVGKPRESASLIPKKIVRMIILKWVVGRWDLAGTGSG